MGFETKDDRAIEINNLIDVLEEYLSNKKFDWVETLDKLEEQHDITNIREAINIQLGEEFLEICGEKIEELINECDSVLCVRQRRDIENLKIKLDDLLFNSEIGYDIRILIDDFKEEMKSLGYVKINKNKMKKNIVTAERLKYMLKKSNPLNEKDCYFEEEDKIVIIKGGNEYYK